MTEAAFCPGCGQVLAEDAAARIMELERALDLKEEALRDLEYELRAKRSQISRYKRDRDHKLLHDPRYPEAEKVFDYWRERLAPNARELSGDRLRNVIARLDAGHTVDTLKQAIDGCALKPYVISGRGRSATGNVSERNIELSMICENEARIMRFLSYTETAREAAEGALVSPAAMERLRQALDHPHLLKRLHELRGWTEAAIRELGLGLHGDRVVIPIHDAEGKLTGLHRYQANPRLRGNGPKLLAKGDRNLFPAPETVDAKTVWLVEGEPDAIAMRSIGYPVVSVPGVNTWKQGWPERFERFERILICFDCDDQGRKAASMRQKQLAGITTTQVVDLDSSRDDGFDVGDLLIDKRDRTAAELSRLLVERSNTVIAFQPTLGTSKFEAFCEDLERHGCRVRHSHRGHATSNCPNHEDAHPSLSVTEADDGRVLLHCHAGCDTEAVAAAIGWKLSDLFAA